MNKTQPLIIAHRGASALAPENTLASFRKAIEHVAEGIEFDVRLSKDGVPVVFHDSKLSRICGTDQKVSSLNLNQLNEFDIGSWFNKKYPMLANASFADERIKSLVETLEFLADYKGVIYVELKCKEDAVKDLTKAVCEIIKTSPLLSQIIVKSFNLDALPLIARYCSKAKTGALFAPDAKILLRKEKRLIKVAKELKADRLSLHFSLATKKLMAKAENADLPVTIWTADSPRWIKRGLKLGIDHIITNDPAKLIAKRYDLLRNGSIMVE